jgi:hypothetical protein
MKQIIMPTVILGIIYSLMIGLVSCDSNIGRYHNEDFEGKPTGLKLYKYNADLQIVEFEGCEYMYYFIGDKTLMTHKGNCKNQIHCYNE